MTKFKGQVNWIFKQTRQYEALQSEAERSGLENVESGIWFNALEFDWLEKMIHGVRSRH